MLEVLELSLLILIAGLFGAVVSVTISVILSEATVEIFPPESLYQT